VCAAMRFRHIAALALVGWYLMLPATTSTPKAANASPVPSVSIWDYYNTREACEQDRISMLNDPVIGERMKEAKCAQSPAHQKTPLAVPTQDIRR
jgi:hypothetical protein